MNDPMTCDCSTWARSDARAEDWVNHHPTCPHRHRHDGVRELCRKAAEAMSEWGANEDGVPDHAWHVYQQLRMMGGLAPAPDPTVQPLVESLRWVPKEKP